ncbi:hypothetical protein B5M09_011827 [Aphanomyces astaci]|uniref:Uncharacterized protein n=1 Tax=Aphanomyces astaci TaxID=112090 RepID=A0A3R7YVG0_APHAT|nr:hypothetical protein B5M09_011827 [Aphanomyces astaci]
MKYHRADVTQYDTISLVEADWYDQPGTYEEVTTYDRKMFYPSTLGIKATTDAHRFEFPTKAGKVGKINLNPSWWLRLCPNLDDDDARYYLREILTQSNGFTFYKLGDKSKPYFKHQFRIKPFLLSHCRRIMANLVLKNADKVNRIMTDSITYEGNVEIDAFMFSKKDDMSGRDATIVGNSLKMF